MKLNLDLTKSIPANHVIDELHNNVGSSKFYINHDKFRGSTDMVIRTASGGGGTLLVEGADYVLLDIDADLTGKVGANVYSSVRVDNVTYQTGSLYFSYWVVADLVDANDVLETILSGSGKFRVATSNGFNYIDFYANGLIDIGNANSGMQFHVTTAQMILEHSGGSTNFQINCNGNTNPNSIILNSTSGGIAFRDSIQSGDRYFSQTNANGFSTEFGYQSQTDFDWTVRSIGTAAVTSIMGAVNTNRQDLFEYVELVRTQGAAIGVAAGSNLVGCDGIVGVTPQGKTLGADSNLQEMLEGLTVGFANSAGITFSTSGSGAIYLTSTNTASDSVTIDTAGGFNLITANGFSMADDTSSGITVYSNGQMVINSANTAADAINIDSAGGIDVDAAAGSISLTVANGYALSLFGGSGGAGYVIVGSAGSLSLYSAPGSSAELYAQNTTVDALRLYSDGGIWLKAWYTGASTGQNLLIESEIYGGGGTGGDIVISTKASSGTAGGIYLKTANTNRITISVGGDTIFYGTASPTGALPVITLDQADTNEPFLKFIGDAASADLTRDLVDTGDVTTPTIVGYLKIEILDDGNQIADGDYFIPFYSLA